KTPRAPATGQSTFDFSVRPHAKLDAEWAHQAGQVEIDALLVGRRSGKSVVFVVEAKIGEPSSLAKHKLVYPALAVAPRVPDGMEIVPVYLRVTATAEGLCFAVAECSLPDPRGGRPPAVSELQPGQMTSILLPLDR
ncbi:DUF6997 domain-containing protein, partial [Planctomycetota bacterium]